MKLPPTSCPSCKGGGYERTVQQAFSLTENLYAAGSPVVIAAGALLKDNQTGKVLAQLKLRSISGKTVKAATVLVSPLDTVGKPLGEPVAYQYLDLHADRDGDFGQKAPIALPDAATRSFTVSVTEVIFADNSIWNGTGAAWKPLNRPKLLDTLDDGELAKQFRIEYGSGCDNLLMEQEDLWHCVCGALNHREESCCHKCRKALAELQAIDMEDLRKKKDQRVAQERAEAEAARIKARQEAEIAAAKAKKIGKIAAAILSVVVIVSVIFAQAVIPFMKYSTAEKAASEGEIARAAMLFGAIDYKDSKARSIELWNEIAVKETVTDGAIHTVGLKADGTVVAVGSNQYGQCDVSDWTGIVAISAGYSHTVGLKKDGTVVAVGNNDYGRCDVSDWTGIVAISAGGGYTVGLKADGTVVTAGSNKYGQCDVSDWTGIVAISAGFGYTVGLKADGTVVAVGFNISGQCNVSGWRDIKRT